ncbi:hypothetical protein [Frondihabitans australicus]|uniref:hypothetical protein n=1 Tax=Frondihabitans australicus TaxID=386892 RepID=UPI000EB178F4|nr:hypothetical protein [Frondihabitans australicus]
MPQLAVPDSAFAQMLVYRKDLFAKAGLPAVRLLRRLDLIRGAGIPRRTRDRDGLGDRWAHDAQAEWEDDMSGRRAGQSLLRRFD